ncbi:Calcium-independent phospholipase A2-gamma [Beauveria bassiana]|nr:Calcium-independent phospholipase A2-gamma [Beauveria bassiana]
MPCEHTLWARLVKDDDNFALQVTDRPRRLLDQLRGFLPGDSMEVVFMLGNESKVAALRDLAVAPYSTTQREIHFVVGLLKGQTSRPLLIVETDVLVRKSIPAGPSPPRCHEVVRHRLPPAAQATSTEHAADWTISRLALPFAGVVCIFVKDIAGGLRSIARHLASWLSDGPPSDSPVLPRLLLIDDESDGKSEKQIILELSDCLDEVCRSGSSLLTRFAGISVAGLGMTGTPHERPNWQDFRAKLATGVSGVQKRREQTGRMLSAKTLCRMMERASSTVSSVPAPLDLPLATRVKRPVSQYLEAGVVDLLDHVDSAEMLEFFAIPVVASSIIFDHYMRDMHLFDIAEVFDKLYRAHIDRVFHRITSTSDESRKLKLSSSLDFLNLLMKSLGSQFREFRGQRRSALLYHADKLISFQQRWKKIRSSATCFSCLKKRPQHELPCKHWICAACYDHFSVKSCSGRNLPRCVLCGEEIEGGLRIRKKPETAAPRVLCVDGGGARAGKPLASLKALRDKIGLGGYPVQDHFDVIFGTSSGAIVACALADGKSVDECVELFEAMAQDTFQQREVSSYPFGWTTIGRRFWRCALTLFWDSKYSPVHLEGWLKAEFGESRTLTDWSAATANGLLVGMPITAVEDTATFVATNQGAALKPNSIAADFQMLSSPDKILLWQAYFPPQVIDGVAYQDGGMTYNNPSALALAAAREQFPEKPNPGMLVSCGTGTEQPRRTRPHGMANISKTTGGRVEKRRRGRPWSQWKLSSVGRVFGAFMSQNDSNREFERVRQHATDGENFFRLDFEHGGPLPALDDITDLTGRRSWAEGIAARSPAIDAVALCIRAQHFYFELDDEPAYTNGRYKCSGRVLCDLDPGSPAQMLLLDGLDRREANFRLDGQSLPGDFLERGAWRHGSVVVKNVTFSVDTRQTKFSIEVCEGENRPYGISGSPFTVDWLVQAQGLDDYFGGGY